MSLHFVLGQKGKDLLSRGGVFIQFLRKNESNYVWRCSNVKDCSGRAYAKTNDSEGEQLLLLIFNIR